MTEMTQDVLERFSQVMLEKSKWVAFPYGIERDLALIQLVIADTSILLEGAVPLEEWEAAMAEDAA